ncbi:acyltransferase [Bacillus sp. FSL R9-9481]|uniref:acyltransferase n=1 Tax=Bacillus sp. FSL R9-9481 TaxID=2921591 RepID=UPI0030FCEAF8
MVISKIKGFIRWKLKGEVPLEHLMKKGLKVGKGFSKEPGCNIDFSHCWLISIGDNVTLAPKVHILAHDASTKRALGHSKIGLVKIGNNVFIGANSTILPNVNIGDNVIIGAGSVVSKDIPNGSIAAGNPAKVIGNTNDYLNKHKKIMEDRPVYDEKWKGNISNEKKQKMKTDLKSGIGYVQ